MLGFFKRSFLNGLGLWFSSFNSNTIRADGCSIRDFSTSGTYRPEQKGKCQYGDGVNQSWSFGDLSSNVKALNFLIKLDDITAHTDGVIQLNVTDSISVINGTVTLAGQTGTIIVNDVVSSSITNITAFHSVYVEFDTAVSANDFDLLTDGTNFLLGYLYDVEIFEVALTGGQITALYQQTLFPEEVDVNLPIADHRYLLDMQGGTTQYDSGSATKVHGTPNNYAAGMDYESKTVPFSAENLYGFDQVGSFDGATNETVTNTADISSEDWTLAGKFIVTDVSANYQILSQESGSGTGRSLLWVDITGGLWKSSIGGTTFQFTAAVPTVGELMEYSLTHDSGATEITLVVNGVSQTRAIPFAMESATGDFLIGSSNTPGGYVTGYMWDTSLTNSSGDFSRLMDGSDNVTVPTAIFTLAPDGTSIVRTTPTYTGRVPRDSKLVDGPCLDFDGTTQGLNIDGGDCSDQNWTLSFYMDKESTATQAILYQQSAHYWLRIISGTWNTYIDGTVQVFSSVTYSNDPSYVVFTRSGAGTDFTLSVTNLTTGVTTSETLSGLTMLGTGADFRIGWTGAVAFYGGTFWGWKLDHPVHGFDIPMNNKNHNEVYCSFKEKWYAPAGYTSAMHSLTQDYHFPFITEGGDTALTCGGTDVAAHFGGNSPSIFAIDDFKVYIKCRRTTTGTLEIACSCHQASASRGYCGWYVGFLSTGECQFQARVGTDVLASCVTVATYDDTDWHSFLAEKSGTTMTLTDLDTEVVTSITAASATMDWTTLDSFKCGLGARWNDGSDTWVDPFTGQVADFKITDSSDVVLLDGRCVDGERGYKAAIFDTASDDIDSGLLWSGGDPDLTALVRFRDLIGSGSGTVRRLMSNYIDTEFFTLGLHTGNQIRLQVRDSLSNITTFDTTFVPSVTGVHEVAMIVDSTALTLTCIFDGVSESTALDPSWNGLMNSVQTIHIGNDSDLVLGADCTIDDAILYNSVKTELEIAAIFARNRSYNDFTSLFQYKLHTGTSEDFSGNGNTGTDTGITYQPAVTDESVNQNNGYITDGVFLEIQRNSDGSSAVGRDTVSGLAPGLISSYVSIDFRPEEESPDLRNYTLPGDGVIPVYSLNGNSSQLILDKDDVPNEANFNLPN